MFLIIPYGNDRRTRRFPIVTYCLLGLNVAIFVLMLPLDRQFVLMELGLVPAHPSISDLVTAMFLHVDVFHLGWNMLFLWLFGPNVEDALGHLEYSIFYMGSGFAAALLNHAVVHWAIPAAMDIPTIGASGAIAGILGIFAARFYRTRIRVFWYVGILFYPIRWGTFQVSTVVGLAIWFLQQLAGGVLSLANPMGSGVAYWSHIGGMVFGMGLAWALGLGVQGMKEYLMEDAQASLEQGATFKAAQNLRAVLAHDPDNPAVHAALARTYAMQQDPENAIPHYERSIQLYLDQGDQSNAARHYDELKHFYANARLDPKLEYRLAAYMLEADRHAPALALLEGIYSSHPSTPEGEISLLKIGDLFLKRLGEPRKAVEFYQRFLAEYPHSPWCRAVRVSLAEARKAAGM